MNANLDPDLDAVADTAISWADRIREEDPRQVFDDALRFIHHHPGRAAQVMLTLAVFFNPDEHTSSLAQRVRAITDARVERIRTTGRRTA